jgi:hypothetical protein
MGSGSARTKSGVVAGTGAAITVEVGFTPKKVKLMRAVSGTSECSVDYFDSMPAGTGFKLTSDGGGPPEVITAGMLTANGVTIPEDPAGSFVIGTDSDINISTISIYWFASE